MSLIKRILNTLGDSLNEGQITLGDFVYHPYKTLYGDLKKVYKPGTVSQVLCRAEKKGLIKRKIVGEKAYITITNFGRERKETLEGRLSLDVKLKRKRWDGKYRIILFDIPEKNRVVRDILREKLKELGFVGWQQSVFVGKHNLSAELKELFEKAGLGDYVLLVETEELGNKKLVSILNKTL